MKKLASIALALMIAAPAFAQTDNNPSDYNRALAAGYKAQFTCSGLWNGGKLLTDIEADELTGIYDRIADNIPTLKAEIDEEERQVRVAFADDMPPRTAIWNRQTGCTAMPIGFRGVKTGATVKARKFKDNRPWPMGDMIPAIRAGNQVKAVGNLLTAAFDAKTYGPANKTSAALIIHNGKIVAEKYKPGHDLHTAQRTWSVAKSIAGTLIGHSVLNGMVDVNKPVRIPEWQKFGDPRQSITIDNLMRMTSGLTSSTAGNRTDDIYMGAASVKQQVTSWPLLYPPATKFRYANNDTLLAVLAAQAEHEDWKFKLGNYVPEKHDFDPNRFFQKLGMTRTYAETDWQDNYILSSQIWTTARDMGRLGMLYLNNGEWEGERLLPENWRENVTTPSGPQPESRGFGYGATFWLVNNSAGIPEDAFAAFGNRGQYLVIIPSMDIVIVRSGYDTSESRFDIEAFTRDVVKALQE